MKNTIKIAWVAFAVALVMGVAGCSEDSSEEKPYVVKYAEGDIVLNDGTKVSYDVAKNYNDTQKNELKAKAIAVIFKADTKNSKALGVGLKHNSNIKWCTTEAKTYEKNITTIQCAVSGSAGNLTFTGDTDGSDNLEQIASFLGDKNDTNDSSKYPAFYFAKNYKDVSGSNVKNTAYESGWYLPAIAELYDVWKVKATVEAAGKLCGGDEFSTRGEYWSSSQDASNADMAYLLNFSNGKAEDGAKEFAFKRRYEDFHCCAIRAFN